MKRACLLLLAAVFCSGQMCAGPPSDTIPAGFWVGPVTTTLSGTLDGEPVYDQQDDSDLHVFFGGDGLPETNDGGSIYIGYEVSTPLAPGFELVGAVSGFNAAPGAVVVTWDAWVGEVNSPSMAGGLTEEYLLLPDGTLRYRGTTTLTSGAGDQVTITQNAVLSR